MKDKNDLAERKYIIALVAIVIVVVYIIRLFTLQITSDDYKKSADSNAFLKKVDFPSRGNITDRNGKLLVFNQPAYDIMVIMNEAKDHTDTLELCQALGITKNEYGLDLCAADSPLRLIRYRYIPDAQIVATPRINVAYAEEAAAWPWRFYVKDNLYVSK